MNLKDIFKGFTNIFKSRNKPDNTNINNKKDGNYHNERNYDEILNYSKDMIVDKLSKEEINFEKLKTISEHTSVYNEKKINGMIKNEEITESIIKNTLLENNKTNTNIRSITVEKLQNEINTVWDILKIKENTQAEHIIKSTPADKWVTMDEIRNNIKIQFNVEYINEKSLYPYLKTLVDINLIKVNNIGKKRTWKKNIIVIENKRK